MTKQHLTAAAFLDNVTVDGELSLGGPITQDSSQYSVLADLDVQGPAVFYSTVRLAADPITALQAATKQYVDAAGGGGGASEVFIGTADPIGTAPTTELWFDTDAPAAMPLDYRWNTAWGVVGEGIFTSTQAGFVGATVDVTNLTVTFTPVVGRRYIYRAKADVVTTVAGDVPVMTICDAANATLDRFTTQLTSTASETWAWATMSETFATTAAVTRKIRLVRALGTGSLSIYASAGNPAKFIVEDVGPVAGAVPAPAQPTIGVEAAKPTAPTDSVMEYFATDTKRKWLWDGLGWIIMSEPIVTSYVPTVTPSSGTFTTLGTKFLNYQRSDGWLEFEFSVAITTNGTAAGGVTSTLPVASAITTGGIFGHGREVNVTGNVLVAQVLPPGTSMTFINYNNTYAGGNGYNLWVTGRYRMASRYS